MRVNSSSPPFVRPVDASRVAKSSGASNTGLNGADDKPASTRSSVSTLAQKLNAAATRADARDKTLPTQELQLKASRILDELTAAQRPGNQLEKMSWSGMSRHDYALITYDETGVFTLAERVAACKESSRQENLSRQLLTQLAAQELSTTGTMTETFRRALAHFKSLPVIEQAQYPEGYAAGLERDALKMASGSGATPTGIQDAFPELAYAAIDRSSPLAPVRQSREFGGIGRELMLSRLFDGIEPPMLDGSRMSLESLALGDYLFLTRQDRDLLSDVYAYAQEQGMDLTHVDLLAGGIGGYRHFDNGRLRASFNSGGHFNSDGWQLSVSFTEKDAAIASRLLNSPAIATTRFDQDYLRHILDPGFGAMSHGGHLEFLEHVVTRFSADAEKMQPPGNRFSRYLMPADEERCVINTSTKVRIPNFKSGFSDKGDVLLPEGKTKSAQSNQVSPVQCKPRSLFELLRFGDGVEMLRGNSEVDRRAIKQSWIGSFWRIIKQG